MAASAAWSGHGSSGGIVVVPVAGVPTARVNLSNPPGVCTVRNQACGLVTTKAWQLPRQERDRPGSSGMRFTTHLDTQFAVEHEEGLLFGQMPVQRTAIASLTLVFQDVQASGCVLPAGADAYQRAHEPHRLLNLRCEDCRCARRAVVLLKGHAPNQTPVNPRSTKGQRRLVRDYSSRRG